MSETATKEASIARYMAISRARSEALQRWETPAPAEPARRLVWELAAADKALTWGFPFRRHGLIAPTHRERIAVDPFRPE
jgi:hypothetical protein